MSAIIGKALKTLRLGKQLTQDTIARQLGITPPAYSKLESGFTDINYSRIEQVAELYGMTVLQLVVMAYDQDNEQANLKQENKQLKSAIAELQTKYITLLEKDTCKH